MKKLIQLVLVLCLGFMHAQAQQSQGKIKGQLTDQTTKEAMPAATVVLLHAKDSTVANTAITDNKGNFEITGITDGSYRLYISFLGYKTINRAIQISNDNKQVALGNITMEHKGVNLNAVEILDEKPPIVVKKDTLEFNADAFKTRENAVVEDLLKKLPGVTVDKDGAITAHGETVTKVLVDGKPFFGNDPKLATKNLPANIIDKVQVIDKKSDQAQFTQIDDGQTEKAINIVIKKDKRKGMFGRATAGYGTDDRFMGSFSLNRFRENQQMSLLGGGNNINNMGYSMQDQMTFSSAGGGGGGRGGGGRGGGRMIISQGLGGGGNNGGITRNWNTGLNFSQDFSKNVIFSGNYFFNDTKRDVAQKTSRQTFASTGTTYYNESNMSQTDNSNNRFSARVEYNIDSFHSIIFTPNYSFTNASSYSIRDYATLNSNKDTTNKGSTINDGQGNSQNLNGNLLFRKRFRKPGRSLSLNLTYSNNINDQQNFNKTNVYFFSNDSSSTFNQRNDIHSVSSSMGANFTYTEPLAKDRFLEVNYGVTRYNSNSKKYTYDFDNGKNEYDQLNDSLSNKFTNSTLNQQAGLALRTTKLKYDYTIGINFLFNSLDNNTFSFRTQKDSLIQQRTLNFAPNASFNYTFAKNKRLRINYNGTTQQPTVQQLQPVPDNSNALYVQQGNPDLKPSFNNNLNINYNQFNNVTFRGMFSSLSASFGSNKIVNSTRLDTATGKQFSKPVNVNGYFSLRGMVHNSIPLSKTPGQNLNSSTVVAYSRDVNMTQGTLNYSNSLQLSQNFNVSYSYKELLDVALGAGVNYNATTYTLPTSQNTRYLDYNFNLDFNFNLPLGFMAGSDITCTLNRGRTTGYNLTSTMWNANIAKYVFPKKQGMIKIQGFDLLRQYVSVSRNVSDNYIEDVQSNVLQQYFMVSFTYFLNKFGGNTRNGERGGMRFMRGGGAGFRHF
ncbi:TonB-dependent receptor [Chitinophaga sp. Mgbs1]|uniref:TonB-dependent receptor n=1 Tax=Chitinophaga solisilvae TaxID=1233460 RepID=A0A3S1D315_9BACT|nr:TonB-dependent receptor [Chitinophaga solisilvae]